MKNGMLLPVSIASVVCFLGLQGALASMPGPDKNGARVM